MPRIFVLSKRISGMSFVAFIYYVHYNKKVLHYRGRLIFDKEKKYLILANMLMPKFRLRGFRRLSDAVVDSLGALERQMLGEVRENGEVSVRQIWENSGETIAYTTIMTTLDRLYKKGLL